MIFPTWTTHGGGGGGGRPFAKSCGRAIKAAMGMTMRGTALEERCFAHVGWQCKCFDDLMYMTLFTISNDDGGVDVPISEWFLDGDADGGANKWALIFPGH